MTVFPQFKAAAAHYRRAGEGFLAGPSPPARGPVAGFEIFDRVDVIAPEWSAFEPRAHMTLYQSLLWCRAWLETLGAERHASPRIVAGRDARGELVFLLPLQLRGRAVRVLEWLTMPDATYGLGLYAPHFLPQAAQWFAENWWRIAAAIGGWDRVALANMPGHFNGVAHPLSALFTTAGANRGYQMDLTPDYEALIKRKQSGESRRQDRKRLAAMTAHGEVAFILPPDRDGDLQAIDMVIDQQRSRLSEQGIRGVLTETHRRFLKRLVALQPPHRRSLLPYMLTCGDETLAVMLCAEQGGTLWGLVSSLAQSGLRRYSPGDLAIRRCIEAGCRAGLSHFDFSSGDTAYKIGWSDRAVQLHEHHSGRNGRGMAVAAMALQGAVLKRLIKQSPLAFAAFKQARKALRRQDH